MILLVVTFGPMKKVNLIENLSKMNFENRALQKKILNQVRIQDISSIW